VFDTVTIAYRGTQYEVGRGRAYYAIWAVGAPRSEPLQWWPETPEGWSAAWARFAEMETPGTIAPAGRNAGAPGTGVTGASRGLTGAPGAPGGAVLAALLLAAGVALGVAGLFPAYLGGSSLVQQTDNLVAHVIYLAGWSAGAVLILLGGTRQRTGALLAAGLSVVTFGLFFADAGLAISGSTAGAGLVLSLLGWLVCAVGSAVAFLLRPARAAADAGPLGRPRASDLGPAVLVMLAGLGAAIAFAPAWDSFTLRTSAGQTQTITAGNAFTNPGLVIAGDVAVMVALAAVVVAAALWRPLRYGAALLAGATIPMVAQAISALVQVGEPASPAQFGISSAQASQLGLTISSGLTPSFWIYCGCLIVLVVSCAWMLFAPDRPAAPLAGAALAPGPGADPEVEQWHVARSGPIGGAGAQPAPRDDQADRDDLDDDFDDDDDGDNADNADDDDGDNADDADGDDIRADRQSDRHGESQSGDWSDGAVRSGTGLA
jgi:hypothetical protein